ncbi:RNA-directed DNA polymerase from mobile element jockey-like [Brachionus plicatilis]|uniref:RNA-directed DNA polymerase from mobile element jockey-like n=1 Tax=Brachionus plicatilis TaxID=10195 RepID=A0A3M7S1E2_BRAPC|nr:RNA-directed DNA polymerase from mobile element jockey-like [Brachionus plicatilis]
MKKKKNELLKLSVIKKTKLQTENFKNLFTTCAIVELRTEYDKTIYEIKRNYDAKLVEKDTQIVNLMGRLDAFSDIVILGDFNFPEIEWTFDGPVVHTLAKSIEHEFIDSLNDNYLSQMIEFPTFKSSDLQEPKNTLDLVLVSKPYRIDVIQKGPQLGHSPKGRAHYSITWQYLINEKIVEDCTRDRYCYQLGKYDLMVNHLNDISWSDIFKDKSANECYEIFLERHETPTMD